jgi:hypothetical protein
VLGWQLKKTILTALWDNQRAITSVILNETYHQIAAASAAKQDLTVSAP